MRLFLLFKIFIFCCNILLGIISSLSISLHLSMTYLLLCSALRCFVSCNRLSFYMPPPSHHCSHCPHTMYVEADRAVLHSTNVCLYTDLVDTFCNNARENTCIKDFTSLPWPRYHQSCKLLHPGLAMFTPPRRRAGSILPPMMVFSTIDSTSCGVTRPYHTPTPCGM